MIERKILRVQESRYLYFFLQRQRDPHNMIYYRSLVRHRHIQFVPCSSQRSRSSEFLVLNRLSGKLQKITQKYIDTVSTSSAINSNLRDHRWNIKYDHPPFNIVGNFTMVAPSQNDTHTNIAKYYFTIELPVSIFPSQLPSTALEETQSGLLRQTFEAYVGLFLEIIAEYQIKEQQRKCPKSPISAETTDIKIYTFKICMRDNYLIKYGRMIVFV